MEANIMMRGLKRCILLSLLILSAVISNAKTSLAYQGKVKVYIICLSNVGGWSFPNKIINTQKVADGAMPIKNNTLHVQN
jgi:hypothetical protein